ncbi:MAG: hypothetical protein ABI488_18225 [Polyangiaceae bacterium]
MRTALRNSGIALLVLGVLGARLYGVYGAAHAPAEESAAPQPSPPAAAQSPGSTVPVATVQALPPPSIPATLDESALMAELRSVQDSDPELALALARDGNQRFPDSAQAPERAASMVHSLTALGRASAGRAVAEDMVNHYPDSTWVRQIEQYTGAHRHRNVRTNAAGQLEYY